MFKEINPHSKQDKLAVLDHYVDFSLPNKVYINSNISTWIRELYSESNKVKTLYNSPVLSMIPTEYLDTDFPKKHRIVDEDFPETNFQTNYTTTDYKIIHAFRKTNDLTIQLTEFMKTILKMPAETPENMNNIFEYMETKWNSSFMNKYNQDTREDIFSALSIIINDILTFKFAGMCLYTKITADIRPGDDMEWVFNYNGPTLLLQLLIDNLRHYSDSIAIDDTAALIVMLLSDMKLDPARNCAIFSTFVECTCGMLLAERLREKVKQYTMSSTDIIQDVENLSRRMDGNGFLDWSRDHFNRSSIKFIESLRSNAMSEEKSNTVLVFGDDLTNGLSVDDFVIEVEKILSGDYTRYISDPDRTRVKFNLSDDDIAFVHYELKPKNCIVKWRDKTAHLIKTDANGREDVYVLFRCSGDPVVHGISIDRDIARDRIMIDIQKNDDAKYVIARGGYRDDDRYETSSDGK